MKRQRIKTKSKLTRTLNVFSSFAEAEEADRKYWRSRTPLQRLRALEHGYHRATNDLDVWIAVNEKNAELVSRVLQTFAGFPKSQVPASLFLEPRKVFIFGREPVRIDILTGPTGIDFEQCYARREEVRFDGCRVPLISLEDLKTNRKASGRLKDLADIEGLGVGKWVRKSKPRGRKK